MYAVYQKTAQGPGWQYIFEEETSLFGCNVGYIPKLLKTVLEGSALEPLKWHINIEDTMARTGLHGKALIINLKPTSSLLSLYELVDVWGHSSHGWTPVMFCLRGLFVEHENPVDVKRFARTSTEIEYPIFSMMYLAGTVKDGAIHGKWTPPGPSSTQSVLLWPETFEYFHGQASKVMERAKG